MHEAVKRSISGIPSGSSKTLTSHVADLDRKVMLYWDEDTPFPPDIIAIREKWRKFTPGWNVALFGKETACRHLQENYGRDIARLFLTCAIPAMRADFFRVFWAMAEGGIYSDVKYVPRREPLFFDPRKNLTAVKKGNGKVIRNSVFYAKKGCNELKSIAFEIEMAVSKRELTDIWESTGPGQWTKVLSLNETSTVAMIESQDLFRTYLRKELYFPSDTRGTNRHWIPLQRRMSIYQDPPGTPDGVAEI